jgi:peroxiredoxin Q/BCP
MRLTLLAALLLPALLQAPEKETAPPRRPAVGAPAPAFRLNDDRGQAVALGGEREAWTVLAFYPKAMTPGCTRECRALRDGSAKLAELGVEVYGVSLDSVADQARFREQEQLSFPLLSDPDGSVAAKYGVLEPGRPYPQRVTFVIDEKGILRHVDEKVSVDTHAEDLAALVQKLRG